ncbi:alcohol dehydrogenase GroES-like domain-containing protein [Nemania diffusa]|nr:alcohol dehydrogenase GroES-like domain-containing protein [Nemania diffusa]
MQAPTDLTQHDHPSAGQRKVLVGASQGRYKLLANAAMPQIRPGTMLCRTVTVALNPADAKMIDYSPSPGSVGGCEFAGIVVQIGENVKRFEHGDRVCGLAFGLNEDDKETGAFSDYVLAVEDVTCHIPQSMSFEEASTFAVAGGTAGYSLYQQLKLPLPGALAGPSFYVLVSGGATSTGMTAIQLLKNSGLKPIATCSLENEKLLQSLGAIKTFDYHSSTCGSEIREYTENSLSFVLDCITTPETTSMCYDAISSKGGRYLGLDPVSARIKYTRRDISTGWVVALSLFGLPVKFSGIYGRQSNPDDRLFAVRLYTMLESLIEQQLILPPRFEVQSGGLEAIEKGIERLRQGSVKGRKLVYLVV